MQLLIRIFYKAFFTIFTQHNMELYQTFFSPSNIAAQSERADLLTVRAANASKMAANLKL